METAMLFQALREFTTGLLNQLLVNLAGEDGQMWLDEFKKFLRREPCWVGMVKVYLKKLFEWEIGAIANGKDTHATAREVFTAYFDPDFENWGIVFSGLAPKTKVVAEELVLKGKFSDFLGDTAVELEKRHMLGSQFLAICRNSRGRLRDDNRANFFVLTKGDEAVAKDLSNVFVARVLVYDGGQLSACLNEFRFDDVWDGDDAPRVFSLQQ